jgi:DNA (cytosine-5)-methyltransferase 1
MSAQLRTVPIRNFYAIERPESFAARRGRPTVVELFCGAGGLSLGLANAGWDVRLGSDFHPACAATHQRNFPRVPFYQGDIRLLTPDAVLDMARIRPGELDMLAGGPPCQGFSILGQRAPDDPRNGLFGTFLDLAAAIRPKVILIENVPGLATLDGGRMLSAISRRFDEMGYDADCAELVAAQYGVPQLRWRLAFIAWRRDLGKRGGFPHPTHGSAGIGDLVPNRTLHAAHADGFLSVFDAIGDLPEVAAGGMAHHYTRGPQTEYQVAMRAANGDGVENHYAPKLAEQNIRRILALKPGQDWRALPNHLLPAGMQRALRKDHTRRYRRMTWEGVARSIITRFRDPKSGEYIHPEQTRTISIREAARIQSFPDWFVFCGSNSELYDQVGNAVPPLLARAIGAEVLKVLKARKPPRFAAPKSRYRLEQLPLALSFAA